MAAASFCASSKLAWDFVEFFSSASFADAFSAKACLAPDSSPDLTFSKASSSSSLTMSASFTPALAHDSAVAMASSLSCSSALSCERRASGEVVVDGDEPEPEAATTAMRLGWLLRRELLGTFAGPVTLQTLITLLRTLARLAVHVELGRERSSMMMCSR
eukprot:CAMPEP_0202865070 /NCGR_PEP_ID=MMETSP1391-20130828/5194_1 /ASSEMBLY_ACC=CAM_ASM_000867 /TAXON_ID=1034604 /ORGANISM="Chlamydomonas leiostraca, Strain SAG 11-49" /LENGTH=159 /DNA_ID=CAMNT_0049544865 /DNA_START=1089 /DNA_END=1568 /DNA_ORIENTATION=-